MITPDGKHCTVKGIIVWDGITRPEMDTPVGKPKHSLKIVIHPQDVGLQEVGQLAQAELLASEFKGQLPPGANWAITPVQENDAFNLNGMFNGYMCINAGTYQGAPQVFDMNGNELPAMTYGPMLYPGAMVELLVRCYAYNNKQKGVASGLSGVRIVDATTPRLAIGAGIDAATVFGGGAQATAAPAQVAPAAAPLAAPATVPLVTAAPAVQTAPATAAAPLATAAVQVAPAVSSAHVVDGSVPGGAPAATVAPAVNYLP